MLRAAAAAAWVVLPACGYLFSYLLQGPDSADNKGSSCTPGSTTSTISSKSMPMIYSSKSALPSEWDKRQWGRHHAAQQFLKVDGLSVKYIGPGETDAQAASIFADHAVPQDVPLYYFEVTVVNKGAQGFIGVGFCSEDVNLARLPGWEPHSYGYHGDDGHAFHGSGSGRAFGPPFGTGDVVGALLDRGQHTISYFKNGEPVGTAFYGVHEQQLYPCVGMRTANEEIRANFGCSPFAVDLAALQQQFRQRVLNSIAAVPLPAAVDLSASPAARFAGGSGGGAAAAAGRPSSSSRRGAAAGAAAAAAAAGGGMAGGGIAGGSGSDAAAAAAGEAGGGAAAAAPAAAGTLQSAEHALLAALGAAAAAAAEGADPEAAAGPGQAAGSSKASACSQPLLPYLVFDYLLHQRCWQTAAVVARDMLGGPGKHATAAAADSAAAAPMDCSSGEGAATAGAAAAAAAAAGEGPAAAGGLSAAAIQDALTRQQVFDAVAAGRLADALQQVERHYGPSVLQGNAKLAFKLKVQHFVELVRQATCGDAAAASTGSAAGTSGSSSGAAGMAGGFGAALAYGRAELGPGSKSPDEEELLADALSLLAYADPGASPCGHLLRPGQRLQLAQELNGALLQARGMSAQPLLESYYRQAVVLLDELKRLGVPSALVLDVPALCLTGPAAVQQQQQQHKGQQAGSSAAGGAAGGRHES
ncbi:hypothetical protein COO60DRAFT_452801 [Scenedesmus sp. NREL 46B-D3]|nr:hypothetical protein COO60DRAFT_452801 [Scenedesmus sp. NREL 46B-D3]